MNEIIKITLDTPSGTLYRQYTVIEDMDWNDVIPDMLNSIHRSNDVLDEINQDAGNENQIGS